MEQEQKKRILGKLQNLCVRREYCESDIYAKALKMVEGDEALASDLLQSLVADQFVSNLRYASAYSREKASISGWGAVKIRYMLSHKGIDSQTISEALQEIDQGRAHQRLERLLAAKYRQIADDPQCKLKLIRYALSRGYGYEEIRPEIEKIVKS